MAKKKKTTAGTKAQMKRLKVVTKCLTAASKGLLGIKRTDKPFVEARDAVIEALDMVNGLVGKC